jgi:hypothetical protein
MRLVGFLGEPEGFRGCDLHDVPAAEVQRRERLEDQGLRQQRDASVASESVAGATGEHQCSPEVADNEAGTVTASDAMTASMIGSVTSGSSVSLSASACPICRHRLFRSAMIGAECLQSSAQA